MKAELKIEGMMCPHCEARVKKALEALPGVTYEGVSGKITFDDIGDAIRDTAYIKHSVNDGTWELETVQTAK